MTIYYHRLNCNKYLYYKPEAAISQVLGLGLRDQGSVLSVKAEC